MAKAKVIERRQQREQAAASSQAPPAPGFLRMHLRELGVCAALAVAVWLIFSQIGTHGYVNFDDWDYVGENLAVLSGLSWEGVKFAFTTNMTANWHPVTWLSHMLDVQLFGEDPGAMHLSSMWLHAANAVLLFVLLRTFTGALWRSAAVAALFAIHPLHVEPVAWLSDRKDLVATFFWLLTAISYGYWATRERKAWDWFVLAHVWAALAFLSKPTTVTLPFTLLLLDLWPLRRLDNLPRRLLEKSGFFLFAIGISVATYIIQRDAGATTALVKIGFAQKLTNAIASYGVYLWQTVWPRNLTPMYPYPETIQWVPTLVSAVVLAAVSVLALLRIRQQPYIASGWFWYLGVLAPMIGIVQVGIQSHADRYTYVSLIGIFWIIVWGLHDLLGESRWRMPAFQGATAVVALALMWQSYAQAALWVDDRTLFGHTLAVTERNRLANTVVGLSHMRAKNLEDADRHLRAALKLDPSFMPAYLHLAELQFMREQPEEALTLLDKAIQMEPGAAVSYHNRGIVLRSVGRNADAVADFEKALKMGLDTDRAKRAHLEIGLAKRAEGKHEEALSQFKKAMELDPSYYLAEKNVAFTYYAMKDYEQALYWFQQLRALNPNDQDVTNALASIKR